MTNSGLRYLGDCIVIAAIIICINKCACDETITITHKNYPQQIEKTK